MAKENEDLLDEVYKATAMGLEATQMLIPKVHNGALKEQIEQQSKNYKGMAAKAKAMLREDGRLPNEQGTFQKAMLRGSIKMKTMNPDPKHIAEMMINGTTMGIINITKKINELDEADAGARQLAEQYIANEQRNIEDLKRHL